jgi:hypothetical protein
MKRVEKKKDLLTEIGNGEQTPTFFYMNKNYELQLYDVNPFHGTSAPTHMYLHDKCS